MNERDSLGKVITQKKQAKNEVNVLMLFEVKIE